MTATPTPRIKLKLYSVEQAAEYLGVHRTTVSALINNGQIAATNVSKNALSKRPHWRITEQGLRDFQKSRSATPSTPDTKRRRTARPANLPDGYVDHFADL
jgi:excisionase family DNA binding protein